jgi:hypothetical protein
MTEQQELRAAIVEAAENLAVAIRLMDQARYAGGDAAEWLDSQDGREAIPQGSTLDQALAALVKLGDLYEV